MSGKFYTLILDEDEISRILSALYSTARSGDGCGQENSSDYSENGEASSLEIWRAEQENLMYKLEDIFDA